MGNYNYGNLDIDEQINNYSDHYNKLRLYFYELLLHLLLFLYYFSVLSFCHILLKEQY